MFARCPHCSTVFAITAAHLRAARGEVQCGRCEQVFDALPHLADSPREAYAVPPPGPGTRIDDGTDAKEDPGADAAASGLSPAPPAGEAGHPGVPASEGAPTDEAAAWQGERSDEPPSSPGAPEAASVAVNAAAPQAVASPAPVDGSARRAAADGPIPAALVEDLEREPATASARPRSGVRVALAAGLLLALGLQYAWFSPRDLIARYPQARELIASMCALTGCREADGRAPERMRVVTRAVRVHPRYEGALRVQAVVVNTATYAQPYPRVRFSLFNVNGETIGSRVFEPREYLGVEPASHEMIAPRTPVQIALELLAPEEVAVSYEFKFL